MSVQVQALWLDAIGSRGTRRERAFVRLLLNRAGGSSRVPSMYIAPLQAVIDRYYWVASWRPERTLSPVVRDGVVSIAEAALRKLFNEPANGDALIPISMLLRSYDTAERHTISSAIYDGLEGKDFDAWQPGVALEGERFDFDSADLKERAANWVTADLRSVFTDNLLLPLRRLHHWWNGRQPALPSLPRHLAEALDEGLDAPAAEETAACAEAGARTTHAETAVARRAFIAEATVKLVEYARHHSFDDEVMLEGKMEWPKKSNAMAFLRYLGVRAYGRDFWAWTEVRKFTLRRTGK